MKYRTRVSVLTLLIILGGQLAGGSQKPPSQKSDTVRAMGFRVEGGLVNFSEGEVSCTCHGVTSSTIALQPLENGDSVFAGDHGRAEILLEPGYYLRVAPNSEVRLLDLSAFNLKIKVMRGSAILEIAMIELVGLKERFNNTLLYPLTVLTPSDDYAITRGGAYHFSVQSDSGSAVKVSKGLAIVSGSRVEGGMSAAVRNGQVTLTLKDSSAADEFDTWSSNRAAILVEANRSLKKLKWYKQVQSGHNYLDVQDPEESAQANSAHIVSARNGVVQFVEDVALLKIGSADWKPLHAGDSLTSGSSVKTIPENRLELSPSPGFDLFLAGDSEIVFAEQPDGLVRVSLVKGSIVVHCLPPAKVRELNSLIVAADREYEISERGSYRFNVFSSGRTELLVFSGALKVAGEEIRADKGSGRMRDGDTEGPLNKLSRDSFDVWSSRGRRSGQERTLKRILGMGGLWYLNEAANQYTFVPMSWEHRSPYGGKYSVKYTAPPRVMRPGSFDPTMGPPRIRSGERDQQP